MQFQSRRSESNVLRSSSMFLPGMCAADSSANGRVKNGPILKPVVKKNWKSPTDETAKKNNVADTNNNKPTTKSIFKSKIKDVESPPSGPKKSLLKPTRTWRDQEKDTNNTSSSNSTPIKINVVVEPKKEEEPVFVEPPSNQEEPVEKEEIVVPVVEENKVVVEQQEEESLVVVEESLKKKDKKDKKKKKKDKGSKKKKGEKIYYSVFPGTPLKYFRRPDSNDVTNNAAIQIQRIVRGKCTRTNCYILKLQKQLRTIKKDKISTIQDIQENMEEEKFNLRQGANKEHKDTIKKHMQCSQTATEGQKLIDYLKRENKKVRKSNIELAQNIAELKQQNARLEHATEETKTHQKVLEEHFAEIQQAHNTLMDVIPKYEERIAEMKEAYDVRDQYGQTEHRLKVMYLKLIGSLADYVEHHTTDKDLSEEIYCYALAAEDVTGGKLENHDDDDSEEGK